jgi:hypothetical protein
LTMACIFIAPPRGERNDMRKQRKEATINSVMFSYVGTTDDFTKFLQSLVHNYLTLVNECNCDAQENVDHVESATA